MALTLRALVLGARRAARAGRRRARQHQHHKHKYEFHGYLSLLHLFVRWSARRRVEQEARTRDLGRSKCIVRPVTKLTAHLTGQVQQSVSRVTWS
jgi:hypothetical protein